MTKDRADNLEKAIAYYQEALQVYTFDAFPEVWAETQRNLGDAYYAQKIRGDIADNLEKALIYCQEALQVYTKDEVTKTAVITHLKPSDNHCHHFSCHGVFNPNNPLKSALFLANHEPLKLGEIFELNLNQSRLVTLSAYETGLIDLQSLD